MKKKTKYIFTTGGVVSSLGKGILASSLGYLLQRYGYSVFMMKFDPYINIDPGTMNPFEHGEVYVTDDGCETDLDLGHYERYLNKNMSGLCSITTGKVYSNVIEKERRGDYLGATVQVIPHITKEIQLSIEKTATFFQADILIVEIGGTVGDIEGLPFLEAIRQFVYEVGSHNAIFVHLTLIPFIKAAGEIKTKPTQHSVMKLREIGLLPDFLVCRSDRPLTKKIRSKLGLFCNVDINHVIEARDAKSIYEIPLFLHKQSFDKKVISSLNLRLKNIDLSGLTNFVGKIKKPEKEVTVAMCGKYTGLQDAYKSIIESFIHAGVESSCKVSVVNVSSEDVEINGAEALLDKVDGILIPGGFGNRGVLGKLMSIKYARKNKIPFLGICLGMQLAVIEYARNVCGISNATSEEFEENATSRIIHFMKEQSTTLKKGGTMRLGAYPCTVLEGTKAHQAYKKTLVSERHRHRYEVNNAYRNVLEGKGMIFSGVSPDKKLVEIIEVKGHPWFVGCQFHPELKSRVMSAHPLFRDFIRATLEYKVIRKNGC